MKFNLSHFLSKRKLSFEQFLVDNEITNCKEFELFLFANEFIDDKEYIQNFKFVEQVENVVEEQQIPVEKDLESDSTEETTIKPVRKKRQQVPQE